MRLKPLYYHIALVTFLLAIFVQSSIPGDELPGVEIDYFDKLVHFIIYAILFILFFYSLKNQNKSVKLCRFAAEYSLLFTFIYGVTDEIHQYFVPKRSSEFSDVAADLMGALSMYVLMKLFYRKKAGGIAAGMIIPFILLAGCRSLPDSGADIEFKVRKAEAWVDLMPGPGKENNFHFTIEAEAVSGTSLKEEDLMVQNFRVKYDNGGDYYGKAEHTLIKNGMNYIIILKDSKSENYLNYTGQSELPKTAGFSFDLYLKGKKLQSLNTNIIPINKVY